MPAIQMRLVTGTLEQFASVTYTAPAESDLPLELRPVLPDSVTLAIVSPDGEIVPLNPIPERPGIYRARISPMPGVTYHLTGEVAGRSISAETTVPGPMTVEEPSADTLHASSKDGTPQVSYLWHSAGASTYEVVATNGTRSVSYALPDTAGTMQLVAFKPGPDTTQLVIWAFDSASKNYATRGEVGQLFGNVRGALGIFSAVTLSKPKTILWQ